MNEALSSYHPDERDFYIKMKQRIIDTQPRDSTSSSFHNDPTVMNDRTAVHQHQRTIQQIVYGATAEASDVEMADETGTMEAIYPEGNKKKKRNKKKKKNKKDKKEAEEGKAAEPIEIEMIELKPKHVEEEEEVKTPPK